MAYSSTVNYVKFLRGTPTAWEKVVEKDSNTLYFISEPTSSTGELYLGSKLISKGSSISDVSLGDISNINIDSETLDDSSFLIYNADTNAWENRKLEELSALLGIGSFIYELTLQEEDNNIEKIEEKIKNPVQGDIVIVTKGFRVVSYIFDASTSKWVIFSNDLEINEKVFVKDNVGKLNLINFDKANTGDILIKSKVGSLDWISSQDIPEFQDIHSTLFGNDSTSAIGLIDKVGNLETLINDSDNGLEKIQKVIFDSIISIEGEEGSKVPGLLTNVTNLQSQVNNLQDTVNAITGVETIEGGFVTVSRFNSAVGDISQLMGEKTNVVDNLNVIHNDIKDLYEQIQWQELS